MGRKLNHRPWENKKFLCQKYEVEGLSTQEIAKQIAAQWSVKVYPNTVRRALKRLGITIRSKSQAQSNYLENNDHPMLGRERSEDERVKISEGIQKNWDSLSDSEIKDRRTEMAERAKKKWANMTKKEREKNIRKMHKANRDKSGQGSKNENLVAKLLADEGYVIIQRTRDYSPRQQFEIDIAIPSKSIAIEWDGAAHFAPIYGDGDLKKTIEKDGRKNKALLSNKWTVLRCRDHSTAHSLAFCRRAVKKIIDVIKNGNKNTVHLIDME